LSAFMSEPKCFPKKRLPQSFGCGSLIIRNLVYGLRGVRVRVGVLLGTAVTRLMGTSKSWPG
jgi:hypothetical protein